VSRKHLRRSLQNAAAVDMARRPKGIIGWESGKPCVGWLYQVVHRGSVVVLRIPIPDPESARSPSTLLLQSKFKYLKGCAWTER
jgi:hypothetical protein